MRALWQRIREALEGNIRQQITLLGALYSVAVALVGAGAFISGNNLLFLLFAALLSVLLISSLVSRLGLAALELELRLPEHLPARRMVEGRVIVHNHKWISPSFSLHLRGAEDSGMLKPLYFPVVPGGGLLSRNAEFRFPRRGVQKGNTFWFESSFPFGFTHRRAQVRLEKEVLIYPSIDPHPGFEEALSVIRGELEARQRGQGTDFYRIRPYVSLESARHVDWKATAHTGDLQVREFARDEDPAVTVHLDLHLPGGASHDWFEMAVDCCAFLVWRLTERGARVRFLTQRYERRVPEEAAVYDILKYLALVEPVFGARLLSPDDRNIPIAVTARQEELRQAGWMDAPLPDAAGYAGRPDNARSGG